MALIKMPNLWKMKGRRKRMGMKRTKKMNKRKRLRRMMGMKNLKIVLVRNLD
jgi:hypothetical protein